MKFPRLKPLAVAAFTALAALPAQAESLADAMVSAYRHSALMDQNRAVLRAADEDVASAVAALRPVVQWTASHRYSRNIGIETRNPLNSEITRVTSSSLTTSLQVVASMTLYDWGRSQIAIDLAKELVLASRESLVNVEQDVLLAAVGAYFDVRSGAEQVALQENSVRVIGKERQAAQDRFDVGEITVTDVSQADARLAATRARKAQAEGQLEVARQAYIAATGKKPGKLSAPPPLPKLPGSLDGARGVAQRNHPAIRQLQHQVAAAELAVAAAAAERNPELNGSLSASINRSPNQSIGRRDTTRNLSAGLELSQTIYSGGRLPAAHRKAMAQRDQARAGLLQTSRQVSQQVGVTWANIDVARAQIKAIDQQIRAAQQAYDGVREEVTLGARTTLDVLDAEQSLLSAKADKISAEANLQLAHYQLLAAMGLLTVENLKLGIPTYDPTEYYNAVRDAPFTSKQGENLDRVLRAIGKGN